jgi:chloramphenicol-sensitive protein RarD
MADSETRIGLWYALLAHLAWAALPLYWKLLVHVPVSEQLLHRVVWGALLLLVLVLARGRMPQLREALAVRGRLGRLALAAALLGLNWLVFLYAMHTDRVMQSSLGYFLNPIVSVLLGLIVLGERLRPLQWIAVGCAAVGVFVLFLGAGELPWIALVLALAFGVYALLRKTTPVDPLTGNMVENGMLAIPCVIAMLWLEVGSGGGGHLSTGGAYTAMLLLAAGPITALPMLWFTAAARRLSMFTLGFMQYTTPTAHFLLAVFVFGEPFTPAHAVAFSAIWVGVGLFAVDLALEQRRRSLAGPPA